MSNCLQSELNNINVESQCISLCVIMCLLPTFDTEGAQLEAAAGVGVRGEEEEVVANGEGRNIGGKLRAKET